MSHRLKLTLFVLAFNVIGFAEGYLLHGVGLQWLLPVLLVTALAGRVGESAVAEVGTAQLLGGSNLTRTIHGEALNP